MKAVSSFTGGAAAGWILQVSGGGPTIYHTGDTNEYSEMGTVDRVYKPSYALMPIGVTTTSSPEMAALACHQYLLNCHTVIPILFSKYIGDDTN